MKKTFCDICGNLTDDWNDGFSVEDGGEPLIVVYGQIKAQRHIVFRPTSPDGVTHFSDRDIDICVDCFAGIFEKRLFRKIYK